MTDDFTVECRAFTWRLRADKPDPYRSAVVNFGRRRVELTASPTERSFHVHVDGIRYVPEVTS